MGEAAKGETLLKHALKRTKATVKPLDNRGRNRVKTFRAWTVSALLERYTDPRAILLEIAATPTKTLAEQMNASMADALAERRLCAQAVLPYVAQKLPAQVDMRLTRAINLNIVDDRQYQELIEVAATQQDDSDGFNMQLLTATGDEQGSETPAATQQAPPQQERSLAWDIQPGNKGAQRKNVTTLDSNVVKSNAVTGQAAVAPTVPLPNRRGE